MKQFNKANKSKTDGKKNTKMLGILGERATSSLLTSEGEVCASVSQDLRETLTYEHHGYDTLSPMPGDWVQN